MCSQKDLPIIVQKFGGTSLANIERIRNAANRATAKHKAGFRVIVVVSAMAGETDRLLALGENLGSGLNEIRLRELDALISTGEQVSASLMALAIHAQGVPAQSFNAYQVGIHTSPSYGVIKKIRHFEKNKRRF